MKAETLLAKVQKAQQLCEGCHWCREEARLNNEPCCFREYHSNGLDRGTPNCVFAKGITREMEYKIQPLWYRKQLADFKAMKEASKIYRKGGLNERLG